jgi:hypothetical protein
LVIVVMVCASPHAAALAGTQGGLVYTPPVDGAVLDGFREPAGPYGPGNRGLEYATEPDGPVRAAADGEVVFAGSVGGSLHLTVLHPDGLRTSYSFLRTIAVGRGAHVRGGAVLGTSSERLHFGVRDPSGRYLDPTTLFGRVADRRARLVPGTEEGEPALRASETAGFLQLVLERSVPAWITDAGDRALWLHYLAELRLDVRAARVAAAVDRLLAQQEACTPSSELPPPSTGRRIVVLVGGLGSSSTDASVDDIDTAGLGIAPADVVRFSYAGGRVPDDHDASELAAIQANDYASADTHGDLRVAADRLAELLGDVARATPGVPIDVVGHSQGGVVARLAVARSAAAGRLPDDVATLATIASPLDGADLATAASAASRSHGPVPSLIEAGGYGSSSIAVGQLSEVGDLADELRHADVPTRVGRVSIAARGDVVVPTPRTMAEGFPSAIVDLSGVDAHAALPGSPDTTRELRLLQAGAPPTCSSPADVVTDLLVGEGVSWATDAIGAAMLASSAGS